eukprot:CAMPEP_0119262370 /NCGR_PEP_ID=MMETSP1329-20130426/2120_1 /TAXON_ID=114041 /ORGANISM="Genus nov. species nov., Strain RCC1024" /LENGTH=165 /DNA_ID=CAMNT_0007262005 /DNA_START=232 /DNA_END=726 /DNA_ORIENTATION=+
MPLRTLVACILLRAATAIERQPRGPRPNPFANLRNWLPSANVNGEWRDKRGFCTIEFKAHGLRPQLRIVLSGFGSPAVSVGAVEALGRAFARCDPPEKSVDTVCDMTHAVACSPRGLRATRRFLKAHGASLGRVAVVGRGLSIMPVRVLVRVWPPLGRKLRVFGD